MRAAVSTQCDWNMVRAKVDRLANDVGALPSVGEGVDRGIFRDCVVLEHQELGHHGSDHQAHLFRLRLRSGDLVTMLWWNVCVNQGASAVRAELRKMITRHAPHVISLCETYKVDFNHTPVAGYRTFQGAPDGGSEANEVAVLVAKGIEVRTHGFMRMRSKWKGPKHGLVHDGRINIRVRLRFPKGGRLRHVAGHGPFGEGPQEEFMGRIGAWIGKP